MQLLPRQIDFFRLMKLLYASGGSFHSAACVEEANIAGVHKGALFTWGGGSYGKLGQGDTSNSLIPQPCKGVGSSIQFLQERPHSALMPISRGTSFEFQFGSRDSFGPLEYSFPPLA